MYVRVNVHACTPAQVYGAVTMNNTMCLGLFLLVMHLRQLPWTYSSEVLVTVGVCPLPCTCTHAAALLRPQAFLHAHCLVSAPIWRP